MLSRSALLGLLVVLMVGCGGTTAGSPSGVPATGTSPTSSNPSNTTSLPARPREIVLDDLDPCTLWTPEQLEQLAVGTTPVDGGPQEDSGGYQVCAYHTAQSDDKDLGYSVTAVTDLDASVYLGGTSSSAAAVVVIAGFPAVQETTKSENASPCMVAVSTANDQHLQVRADTRPGAYSVAEACEMTTMAATFAVQTLQAIR